ncbi:Permease of the drug/metabolite transporter (DMT) superfamily [Tistlia consotensis]|uniref:Permease of the drug/metabolite transporter (DMT) superfamily n=1 Tax=Tistlia consotensis USBA 355 TaxID=560819 RepID=A0A1Y6C7L9_9PROT|nr:DMT family transporter [Tistlia consotensis]SMF38647.1 Permease of the drug/metabolite transporter (DMT) superfamily [Tistlia consotensis USBA 355]SNR36951.1 Permease of the drug/metabolite transporter (DMT) superfamily [Tistlia consotensis]
MTSDSDKAVPAAGPGHPPGGRFGLQAVSAPMLAALYMVGASLGFTIMNVAIREASQEVSALEVVFFRNFFAMLFMMPWFARAGLSVLRTERLRLYIWRSVIGLVAMMLWFSSLALLPLAEAVTLGFTAPLFATGAAAIFLGEVVRARRWTATAIGFLGVLVVLRPGFQALTWPMALPIVSAAFMAVSIVIVKKLSRTEAPGTIVFFMNVLLAPLSLIPALFVWQWPSWWVLGLMTLVGFVAVFSHVALTRAYQMADASAMLPFDYTKLPFVAALGFALYGEVPDLWTLVGAGIIAGSSLYIAHRESVVARERRVSLAASEAPRASGG